MSMRYGSLFLVGILASVLSTWGCGEEESRLSQACEAFCKKGVACPVEDEPVDEEECFSECRDSGYAPSMIECMSEFVCDDLDGDEEARNNMATCLEAYPSTPACDAGCKKMLECEGDESPAELTYCKLYCTESFSKEVQDCLAASDECSAVGECFWGIE